MNCRIMWHSIRSALFAKLKQSPGTDKHHFIEFLTCIPFKYKMDESTLHVSICLEESIRMKRVKRSRCALKGACVLIWLNMVIAIWASTRENLSLGVCEQQRCRPACTFAQSDQHLCYCYWKVSYLDLLQAEFRFSI